MDLAKANDLMLGKLGLGLLPRDIRSGAVAVVSAVLGVTGFIAMLDLWIFRDRLPADYVAFFTSPLGDRMLAMCIRALGEEVIYRLLYMTAIVAAIKLVRGRVGPVGYGLAAVAAQVIGIWPSLVQEPFHASLRYLAVGAVWGWLYWRQGWFAAAAGHGLSHLLIDPMLLIGLTHTR